MKKILIALLLSVLACLSANASDIDWANVDAPIYDWLGVEIPQDSTWFVRMYESVDGSINFAAGLPGGDDVWTGIQIAWSDAGAPGYMGQIVQNADTTYNLLDGNKCYSVIFNSDSFATATKFAVIDDVIATVNYGGVGSWSYNPSNVVAGDWQAIPEPATAMLLAIGGGVAWLIRLKQRFC